MYSNVYDDVTDFKVVDSPKTQKSKKRRRKQFFSNEQNSLCFKRFDMTESTF